MTTTINGRTPEEIKRGLECCNMRKCPLLKCPYFNDALCAESLNADALAYIQQLERERDAAVERCATADDVSAGYYQEMKQLESDQPKWISVEERLPSGANGMDFCVNVVVYTQDKQVTTGWCNGEIWYLLNWDNDFISKHPSEYVTHWMPLPSTEGIE